MANHRYKHEQFSLHRMRCIVGSIMSTTEDDMFRRLTSGLDIVDPMNADRVLIDLEPYCLDPSHGKELLDDAKRLAHDVLAPDKYFEGIDLSTWQYNALNRRLSELLARRTGFIELDSTVAIEGEGLVLRETNETYEPCFLDGAERLFGRLSGLAFGDYVCLDELDVQQNKELPEDEQEELQIHEKSGLVMVLGGALVCDSDKLGTVVERCETGAIVPFSLPGLILYEAIKM